MKRSLILKLAIVLMLLAQVAHAGIVILPAGNVPVMDFTEGNDYIGVPDQTVMQSNKPVRVTGNNVKIRGITFKGAGVRRDGNLSGLSIGNCKFLDAAVGIEVNGGSNVTLEFNFFNHCSVTTWLSDQQNITIDNNDIVECGYGIKMFGQALTNKNWTARRNYFHDLPAGVMSFEWQGYCDGWNVIENFSERTRSGPEKKDNDHALLFSLPMANAKNGKVLRNVIIGQKPRDDGDPGRWVNGHPLAMEIGGDNTLVDRNILDGAGTGISATDTDGTCSVTIQNNIIRNVYTPYNRSKFQTIVASNNGENIDVGYTVDQARSRAGRSGVNASNIDAVVLPEWKMTYTLLDPQTIRWFAGNVPEGTASITIECISTKGRETGPKVGPNKTIPIGEFPETGVNVKGYHPSWLLDFRGVARNAAGAVLQQTAWATIQMLGTKEQAEAPWPKEDPTPPAGQLPQGNPPPAPAVSPTSPVYIKLEFDFATKKWKSEVVSPSGGTLPGTL